MRKIETIVRNLKNNIGQLATIVGRLDVQASSKLPYQTVVNPRENINAIIIKSGMQLEELPNKL